MKEKKFFLAFFLPTIAASISLAIFLGVHYYGKRTLLLTESIGPGWNDKYNDFLVQKIRTSNGKWILVDADSFDTKLGYFDEVCSPFTGDFAINNLFGKRNDSFFLIDVLHKKILTSFKAESVTWEKQISLFESNGYFIDAKSSGCLLATFRRDSLIGIVESSQGKVISNNIYSAVTFEKDLIRVVKNNKTGYMNRSGSLLIKPVYNQLGYLGEFATASFINETATGIITRNGKTLRSFDLGHTIEYHNKHFIVKKPDTAYLLDFNGHDIFSEPYSNIKTLNQSYLYVFRNGMVGVYDIEKHTIILGCNYDNIVLNEVFYLTFQGLKGIYKPDGSLSIDCKYEDITSANDGKYYIKKHGFWGLANSFGTEIISPSYTFIAPHTNKQNLFYVKKYDKLGLFNCENSSLLIPCEYTEIIDFDDDACYIVKNNDYMGIFNSISGLVIVQPQYREITIQGYDNYARVTDFNGYTGWLDYHTGKVIIPIEYEFISGDFDNRLSRVEVKFNGSQIRIRPDGSRAGSTLKEDVENGWNKTLELIGDKIN